MRGQPIVSALTIPIDERPSDRVAALFDAHHQRVYRLARRLTASADDALDLVQETFLRAARAPKSVPFGPDREEAWLVRVLINVRRDQWRKAVVQKRHDEPRPDIEPDHGPAVIAEGHDLARARHASASPTGRRRHARVGRTRHLDDRVSTRHQRDHGALAPLSGTSRFGPCAHLTTGRCL
jgi:RNA polymerase sigma factor (sigma-70 family)